MTLKAWQVYQWQNNMLCLVGVLLKKNYAIENLICKFTTSVTKLGSVTDGRPGPARRSKFHVPRVFFQKICGFRAGISCSQSFLSKDLWFPGRNFLFPEFSFKRSVVSELGVQADRARPVFEAAGPGRLEFPIPKVFFSKDLWFSGWNFLFLEPAPISGRTVATDSS
jgi:hypothetical protein